MNNVIGFLDRVSDTILPFLMKESLYAAILSLLVLPLSFLLRKKSLFWQTGLWTLVLLRLVLPPDLSFSFSARTALDRYVPASVVILPAQRTVSTNPVTIRGQEPETETAISEAESAPRPEPFPWLAAGLLAWLTGVLFFTVLVVWKRLRFQRIAASAERITDPLSLSLMAAWQQRLGIRRPVRLVAGTEAVSPYTMGVIHPLIYIPRDLVDRGSPGLLESVLAHECAHVKRLDTLWIGLQNLVQIVYFFHPAVWWANSRIHLARECICDQMALSRGGMSPKSYGSGLLSVVRYTAQGRDGLTLLPAFGSEKKRLAARIRSLGKGEVMSRFRLFILTAVLVLLGALVLPVGIASDGNHGSDITGPDSLNTVPDIFPIYNTYITSDFGERLDPFTEMPVFHQGIDLAAERGTQIMAPASGTVVSTKTSNSYGKMIVLDHGNGLQTLYAHLMEQLVDEGQKVDKYTVIGKVGATGRSESLHLHYEVRKDGKPVDPENYLQNRLPDAAFTPSIWPVRNGHISSGFGMRIDPFTGKETHHRGVDIPAPSGTSVTATAFGTIHETGYNDNEGNFVSIRHRSMYTRYTHLDTVLVMRGQNVRRGEQIGTVGETGRTTAPHLHYEVRDIHNKSLDPEDFLKK